MQTRLRFADELVEQSFGQLLAFARSRNLHSALGDCLSKEDVIRLLKASEHNLVATQQALGDVKAMPRPSAVEAEPMPRLSAIEETKETKATAHEEKKSVPYKPCRMKKIRQFLPTAGLQSCPTSQELVDAQTGLVRLRLLMDEVSYKAIQEATVKNPITAADWEQRVPDKLKESIAIWVRARSKLFGGEYLEPKSLKLSCFAIEVSIAQRLTHAYEHQERDISIDLAAVPVPVYIVGDAACALPCMPLPDSLISDSVLIVASVFLFCCLVASFLPQFSCLVFFSVTSLSDNWFTAHRFQVSSVRAQVCCGSRTIRLLWASARFLQLLDGRTCTWQV